MNSKGTSVEQRTAGEMFDVADFIESLLVAQSADPYPLPSRTRERIHDLAREARQIGHEMSAEAARLTGRSAEA